MEAGRAYEKRTDETVPVAEEYPLSTDASATKAQESDLPSEDQEYRTVKKTVTTITTTRYVELPDAATKVEDEVKPSDLQPEEVSELIEEIPAVTKTVTTVTTTRLIEIPEAPCQEPLTSLATRVTTEKPADEEIFPAPVTETKTTSMEQRQGWEHGDVPRQADFPENRGVYEEYPDAEETTITTARYGIRESVDDIARHKEDESQKTVYYPPRAEAQEEYPPVTETVTTTIHYEITKKPEESPVSVLEQEKYQTVTEKDGTVPHFEQERSEELGKEIEAELKKAPESPISTAELEEYPPVTAFEREEYPIVTETVTTTTLYEMESPEEFEKRIEAEVPKAPDWQELDGITVCSCAWSTS
ncbi:unnamed protein product, partial [Haemonchus placei]|uniref:4_1_CTD domain-containing protein n=1 Tax=Haemonchus placei TaxID=6290 RepID=A0A0N4X5V7_HAEPC